MSQQLLHGETAVRGQVLKHGGDLGVQTADENVPGGDLVDEACHPFHRGGIGGAGKAGVGIGGGGGAVQPVTALFVDSHHGAFLALHASERRLDHRAALVQNDFEGDALFLEIFQRLGDAVAAQLFIVGRADVDVAGRLEPLGQQFFQGGKFCEQRCFRVHCAPAPELSAGDLSGEGVVLPFALGGYHIVVGHEHDVPPGVLSGQFVDPAIVGEGQLCALFMHQGEQLRHDIAELGKLRVIVGVIDGYGFAADHLLQPLGVELELLLREIQRGRGQGSGFHCFAPRMVPRISFSSYFT